MYAIKPIFSGDIDPVVNQFDYQKIKAKLVDPKGRAVLNDREVALIEDFLLKRK